MWRRTGQSSWLAVVALAWATACSGPGLAPQHVPDAERAAYEAALARVPAGQTGAAAGRPLEEFLAAHPASPMADDAALRLAELAFEGGRQEDGLRWLGNVLTQYPGSDREPTARLRLAQAEYARDRRVAARGLLDPVDFRRLAPEDARAALRLRVSLAMTPVERMKNLSRLRSALIEESNRAQGDMRRLAPIEKQRSGVEQEIETLVSDAATPELEAMLEEIDRGSRTNKLDREVARSLEAELARRSTLASEEPVAAASSAPAELAPLRELSEYTRSDTRGARGTLGVVLPLSGDFSEFGEASLRGILLAAGVFAPAAGGDESSMPPDRVRTGSEDRDRPNVRVIVRDSAGDPVKAAAAVRELAGLEDVVAILGPVFSDEALAAAEAAEAERVPLVTLSNREDVTLGRKFVLRTRTTPADEVSVLVNHAVDQLAATRFGVLYPKTRYGRGMRKLYWDAILARGGKLVTMASYAPDETDFSNVIKEMVGFRFLSAGEREAIAVRDRAVDAARSMPPAQAAAARNKAFEITGPRGEVLPPIVDFDVLFIPDSAEAVSMIAPGLALQGVRGVRLLGSSDWLDADLLRGSDRHVAGAVISTPFYAASDVGVVRAFVGDFERTFEVAPDAYAAQGFDAASLVLQQLVGRRRDREAVLEGLLAVHAFPGASGSLTMLPDGNARRRPFLLEVSGQRFVPLD